MENATPDQINEMRAAVFTHIAKKCFVEKKEPESFIGHKFDFPIPDHGGFGVYRITVSTEFITAYMLYIREAVQRQEKNVLNGESGSTPTGLLNAKSLENKRGING